MNIHVPSNANDNSSGLLALRPLVLADETRFRQAIELEKPQSWLYYFPFLFCFAQRREMTLVWEEVNSSICLYLLKTTKNGKRLALFVPPLPFNQEALAAARSRLRSFNNSGSCRIAWVEEKYDEELKNSGFDLDAREDEYIYDTQKVISAAGSEFKHLRQLLNRAKRLPGMEIRSFQESDRQPCQELLDRWHSQLTEEKGIEVHGYGYVKACLENGFSFNHGSLAGQVTCVDKKIAGLTFGGPIHSGLGSIFVSISDHAISGLGYLQRHQFMANFPELAYFNDSSDTGRKGLAHVKRQFNPARMNRLSQATGGTDAD
jgi:hypothetical protein